VLTRSDRKPVPLRAPFETLQIAELDRATKTLARKIGAALAELDGDTAAYHVGLTYIGMLSPEHRAANGVYYTPPLLAARLIDRATAAGVDWRTARVLDPACGGGAFLAPVARRIVAALGDCEPRIALANVAQRLRGYEIDPFAAWLSQVALDAVVLPLTRACGGRLPNVVRVCDTLDMAGSADAAAPEDSALTELFDLVIGNPPYGRVRLGAAQRRGFERSLFGHANLYGLFTDVAIRHAKAGGVIAYVTPTSFLAGEYSKRLRALLGREAPPFSFDFVAGREGVFKGVLQEMLLATYRRGGAIRPVEICEIDPVGENDLAVQAAGAAALPRDTSSPWILPRNREHAALAATLAAMPHRLADWGYTVSTGPLVWNRYKNQLVKRVARNRYPVIWAEAVAPDGTFAWRAEKRNHVLYCEIRAGDEWMMVRSACVLVQRTTSKEQSRRLIAAPLPADFVDRHGAVIVENHLNMIRPVFARPRVSHDVLAAFLNSAAADRAFRCVSGSVAVSAYELESLPLPAPDELDLLNHLVASRASSAEIDLECERLYAAMKRMRR
jgi:adenine-specific DNA-methyltransferase